ARPVRPVRVVRAVRSVRAVHSVRSVRGVRGGPPNCQPTRSRRNRAMKPWLRSSTHDAWLQAEAERLLGFGLRTGLGAGGAADLDDDGLPMAGQPRLHWITSRIVYVDG